MMFLQKWIDFAKYGEKFENELKELNIDPSRVGKMLPKMGIGMLIIFVVIGIIALSTVLINKGFSKKEDK